MKTLRSYPYAAALICAVAAGALAVLGAAWRAGEKPRIYGSSFAYRIEDVFVRDIVPRLPFFVADVDLDGNDDLLVNEPTRLLWYRLHATEMSLAGKGDYGFQGSTHMVADANGDGHPEFFVFIKTPDGWMLSCHDWQFPKGTSAPLYTLGPLFPPNYWGRPWMRTKIFVCGDPGAGGTPKIFLGINTLRANLQARRLLAYDGATGRDLWSYEFGPSSNELACGDFGAHGPRVLLTTFAANTDYVINGTADSVSYVFCLDARDGRPIWIKELGGRGGRSSLALADLDGDGQNEILVARFLGSRDRLLLSDTPPWTVMALRADGEEFAAVPLNLQAVSIGEFELDGDPFPEFLVQGSDGELVVLEHDFKNKRIADMLVRDVPVRPRVFGIGDFTDDGKLEIVCRLDSLLFVINPKGAPLAKRTFPRTFEAQIARYDGMNRIVLAMEDSIRVMTLEPSPLVTRLRASARRSTVAAFAAAAFLVCSVGLTVHTHLTRREVEQLAVDEARNDLLTAMSAFGHGGSSLKVLDRIRLHLVNWDRVQSDTEARAELFAKLRGSFIETVVPELQHIVMLAHKAGFPEETWRPVVARADLAGQEMESILASGAEGPPADVHAHVSSALSALEDVDGSVAGIRAHLRSIFRTPVAEALERGAARCRDERGDKKISLSLSPGVSADESVFVSSLIFDKVIETLLSNAARATDGKPGAEIAIEAGWEGNYCTIDIRDNGCGIPRENWEHAFERYYTTKEEGGFGLYYSRAELARFGGKIFVFDSVVDAGTTIRIVLRKSS